MPLHTGLGVRYYRMNVDGYFTISMRRANCGLDKLIRDFGPCAIGFGVKLALV